MPSADDEYRLYRDLADWWPLISPPREYAEEAAYLAAVLSSTADVPVHEVLDLGSGGGHIALRAPAGPAGAGMHTISWITIPAHSTVALKPDGYHLLITGTGPIRSSRDVRLTLVFARAGPVSVLAQPTNPQTGGSTILFN